MRHASFDLLTRRHHAHTRSPALNKSLQLQSDVLCCCCADDPMTRHPACLHHPGSMPLWQAQDPWRTRAMDVSVCQDDTCRSCAQKQLRGQAERTGSQDRAARTGPRTSLGIHNEARSCPRK